MKAEVQGRCSTCRKCCPEHSRIKGFQTGSVKKKKWRVGETAAKHRGLNSSDFFFFLFPFSPTLTRADKTGQQLVAVSLIHTLTSGQAGKWHLEMHTD